MVLTVKTHLKFGQHRAKIFKRCVMKNESLVGKQFGELKVLQFDHKDKRGHKHYLCECSCGKKVVRESYKLTCGDSKNCNDPLHKVRDLSGQVFGQLTVLGFENVQFRGIKKRPYWLCECSCGKKVYVRTDCLTSGNTRSCGHIQRQIVSSNKFLHDYGGRLYRIWAQMKQRCKNPKSSGWKDYGGRGIKCCAEWEDYQTFRNWSLANGYSNELTIDRIDVNGDYCPENCRWVGWDIQLKNQRPRCDLLLDPENGNLKLSELSEKYGLKYATLYFRFKRGLRGKDLIAPIENKV